MMEYVPPRMPAAKLASCWIGRRTASSSPLTTYPDDTLMKSLPSVLHVACMVGGMHMWERRRCVLVDVFLKARNVSVGSERFGELAGCALDFAVVCGEAARAELLTEHLARMGERRARVQDRQRRDQTRPTITDHVHCVRAVGYIDNEERTYSSPILRRGLW